MREPILTWVDGVDGILCGDVVSFISRPAGTRIHGKVVRYVDEQYIIQLRSGRVTVPAREITKECG